MSVEGATVGEIIDALDATYPGIRERLCEGARLKAGIAVAVDGTVTTRGLRETVEPNSEVQILPAIAGGERGASRSRHPPGSLGSERGG